MMMERIDRDAVCKRVEISALRLDVTCLVSYLLVCLDVSLALRWEVPLQMNLFLGEKKMWMKVGIYIQTLFIYYGVVTSIYKHILTRRSDEIIIVP